MSSLEGVIQPTMKSIRMALAGNPNCGKTTIFNSLTGTRQHVGNYPGVTVEKKEGYLRVETLDISIVDLPGLYSFTAYSLDEIIARNFILEAGPDVVVNIVDASNLERSLYFTMQLIELEVPLVVCLNMIDVASSMGISIDTKKLSKALGASVVMTVGHRSIGLDELKKSIVEVASGKKRGSKLALSYSPAINQAIKNVKNVISDASAIDDRYPTRYVALRLLEGDRIIEKKLNDPGQTILRQVGKSIKLLESMLGKDLETAMSEHRLAASRSIAENTVRIAQKVEKDLSKSIDRVVLNKFIGIPLFLLIMYLIFEATFALGTPIMDAMDAGFIRLTALITAVWPFGEGMFLSLITDGIIGGVGTVLLFLPNIMILFIGLALLEDTGYIARAAFLMDRWMSKIGLHGKSCIPLLMGFGCSVPAYMGTRVLANRRDRLITMLVMPLMSCSARIPVYVLIIPAFFPRVWQAPVFYLMYLIGILMAALIARVLSSTLSNEGAEPFVIELPSYHTPTLKGIFLYMWERSRLYIRKAGTILLALTILMWALNSFPRPPVSELAGLSEEQVQAYALSYSVAGRIGHMLEPIIRPIGFDWKIGTAIVGAFAAREVFVAQMGIIYSIGEADETSKGLRSTLQGRYSPLQAFSIILFFLIGSACMAASAVFAKEMRSWKWAIIQQVGLTSLAYLVALVIYQCGMYLGIGVNHANYM